MSEGRFYGVVNELYWHLRWLFAPGLVDWMYLIRWITPWYILCLTLWSSYGMAVQAGSCFYYGGCEKMLRVRYWFSLIRLIFLLVFPVLILKVYRETRTRRLGQNDSPKMQYAREKVAWQFEKATPVKTIFFPDEGENAWSVCHYTGPNGAWVGEEDADDVENEDDTEIAHVEAACIIAFPHVRYLLQGRKLATLEPFPAHALPRQHAPTSLVKRIMSRFASWLASCWWYWTRGEIRTGHLTRTLAPPVDIHPNPLKDDVEQAKQMVHHLLWKVFPHDRFVLMGVGRGAALALKVATALDSSTAAHVHGLLLEGCFSTYRGIHRYRVPSSEDPILAAKQFKHKDMHILIVNSKADGLVPWRHGVALHQALKCGVEVCEFVTLENSRHGHYFQDDSRDILQYELEALKWYRDLFY